MSVASIPQRQFQSSELSRNSSKVFAAAEEHPILVTRRDAAPLILMSEREAAEQRQLFELAAQLIAAITDERGTLANRLADRLPWMLALPDDDQQVCATDLVYAARASLATNQPHLAVQELISWRETAIAIAAGLTSEPVDWLPDPAPVERP